MLGRLRKPTWYDAWQGAERAGRVFVGAFIALYPVGMLEESVFSGGAFDVDLAKKAAIAGTIAAVQFAWRTFLPDVLRSKPELSADPAVDVAGHPHDHSDDDLATDE